MHRNIRQVIIGLCVISAPLLAAQDVSGSRFTIKRFVVEGDSPLPAEETQEVLKPFLGSQKSLSDLKDAAADLRRYLVAEGFPSYEVTLPSQSLDDGVARLVVLEEGSSDNAGKAATVTSGLALKQGDSGYEGNEAAASKSAMPGAESVPVFRFTISGFVIEGDNPLSTEEGREVLAPFLGDHEGISALHAAAETLATRL